MKTAITCTDKNSGPRVEALIRYSRSQLGLNVEYRKTLYAHSLIELALDLYRQFDQAYFGLGTLLEVEVHFNGKTSVYDEKAVGFLYAMGEQEYRRRRKLQRLRHYSSYFSGRKRKNGGHYYRSPKTLAEARMNQCVDEDEEIFRCKARAARNYHNIPNAWDDIAAGKAQRSWKKFRKTQWKN